MVFVLVIFICTAVDVVGKVFSNMFYPTQTQIHREIQVLDFKKQLKEEKKLEKLQSSLDFEASEV